MCSRAEHAEPPSDSRVLLVVPGRGGDEGSEELPRVPVAFSAGEMVVAARQRPRQRRGPLRRGGPRYVVGAVNLRHGFRVGARPGGIPLQLVRQKPTQFCVTMGLSGCPHYLDATVFDIRRET